MVNPNATKTKQAVQVGLTNGYKENRTPFGVPTYTAYLITCLKLMFSKLYKLKKV
jgi:hypothetical protein